MKFFSTFITILFFSSTVYFTDKVAAPKKVCTSSDIGTLQLHIQNIQVKKGAIKVALFNSEETFLNDNAAYLTSSKAVGLESTVLIHFSDVPHGTYSAAIFHDVNNNEQLDKNFFGVPKEPYGFSNNAKSKWGAPKYEAAKFQFNQTDLVMQIDVKTWSQQ